MIFQIRSMSCKCKFVGSMTNKSGPLHMEEQSVVSSHIFDCSRDFYVL